MPDADPPDITRLIVDAGAGTPRAQDELLKAVYDQLKRIAESHLRGERAAHTLGATALVSETYLRLFREGGAQPLAQYEHRRAFYQAASTAMRRILIDHARAKVAAKRGGPARRNEQGRISVDIVQASEQADPADLLALDEAMERLSAEDPRAAEVVRLRFYAGCQLDEIAAMLNTTDRTVKRDWQFARARLQQLLDDSHSQPSS